MYETDGDFGRVRMAVVPEQENQGLFMPKILGWHRVNERYQVRRNEGCAEHILLVTVAGRGKLWTNRGETMLTPGTVVLIPRNEPNFYGALSGGVWEFYWIHPTGMLSESFLDRVAAEGRLTGMFDPTHPYGRLIDEIIDLTNRGVSSHAVEISMRTSQFLHLAAMDLQSYEMPTLTQQTVNMIEQNYTGKLELDQITNMLFVSRAHLIRVFKKEKGITPHQYLIQYRLSAAAQLLRYSTLSVEQISKQVGFSSASHFISSFAKANGCTPLQYKERSEG